LLRELREEDADAVVGVYDVAFGDTRPIDAAEIVSWIRNPELRPEWLKVLEQNGAVVGYGDIWIQDDEVALEVAAPGHWVTFIEWAERTALEQGSRQVRLFFPAGHELAGIVAQRGYRLRQSAYTMQIALGDGPLEQPSVEAGITLRAYRRGDEETVRLALNECFADDPFHHDATPSSFSEFHLRRRGFDPELWRLAWAGDELAGFVLAYPDSPGETDLGWVGVLGVREPWRRRGLGETLLRSAFCELHARGLRRIGLGVDTENPTGALRLYERVGMHPVRRGDNWVLDLAVPPG
jgi:mycothiol synthase